MQRVWHALVHVAPNKNNSEFGRVKGAYVNAAAVSETEEEFVSLVVASVRELEFQFIEVEDLKIFEDEIRVDGPKELRRIVAEARAEGRVAFGVFHNYLENEDLN